MAPLRSLLSAAALAAVATASPVERRAVIGHDEVQAMPGLTPGGTTGDVYLAYQPYLYVANGCVPFPAVDGEGNTSGGLQDTGSSNGKCSSSEGQIYVRSEQHGDYFALMYSWYFPKDSPSTGLGHRHDWEGAIIYLKSATSTAADNIAAVCPSAHGGWTCATTGYDLSGTRPLLKYESTWPVNHATDLTKTQGGSQPLVAWEVMPQAAQDALQSADFGSAIVPFKDSTFTNNLNAATF